MRSWPLRTQVVALLVIAFVVIQVGVPLLGLAQPRPARFGWQMYTAPSSLPGVELEAADGTTRAVDLSAIVARERAEADFSGALAAHLCATTDAVAVRIASYENGRRIPCS